MQLKRRWDLIPNLVETVKGYASHERETFEAVTNARTRRRRRRDPAEAAQAEGILSQALGRLFAVAEAYPELRGDRELPAAPGPALGDGGQGRRQPAGLQRHGADVPQRDPDLPGRRLRRAVRLHEARVLRSRGRGTTGRPGSRFLSVQDRKSASAGFPDARRPREAPARRALSHRLLIACLVLGVTLALPAAASADSFSLLSADVAVDVQDGRLARRERAPRGRVLGRLPLRLSRHPAPCRRVARQPLGRRARCRVQARQRHDARAGNSGHVRRRATRATPRASSGTSTPEIRRARSRSRTRSVDSRSRTTTSST